MASSTAPWQPLGRRTWRLRCCRPGLLRATAITAAIVLAALMAAAFAFHRVIARPIAPGHRGDAKVAGADYQSQVPHLARRDEIGAIAASLDAFRASLAASEVANRAALMRGAALEAGSTAVMLTDTASVRDLCQRRDEGALAHDIRAAISASNCADSTAEKVVGMSAERADRFTAPRSRPNCRINRKHSTRIPLRVRHYGNLDQPRLRCHRSRSRPCRRVARCDRGKARCRRGFGDRSVAGARRVRH